jgi:hypothetical protein
MLISKTAGLDGAGSLGDDDAGEGRSATSSSHWSAAEFMVVLKTT